MRKTIRPGFSIGDDNSLHIDIPELLQVLGVEDTPQTRDEATRMLNEIVAEQCPEAILTNVTRDRCGVCRGRGNVAGFMCAKCGGRGSVEIYEDVKPERGGN